MSWPAPYNPKVMHLWIDLLVPPQATAASTLLGSSTAAQANQTNLLNLLKNNCFNTFTMYQIPSITSTYANDLGDFICKAKSNYGICKVAGVVNPYDFPYGTQYEQDIVNYNNGLSPSNNPCRRIDYITLENEFWNLETTLNPIIFNNSSCCANTIQGSPIVTLTCTLPSTVGQGMLININGIYRQIIAISGSRLQVTLDRNFDFTYNCAPYFIRDNGTFYALDYETFLVRVRDFIRPLAIQNNLLPVEMYISRRLTNDQYERLVPHIDRLLIETEYDTPAGTSATYPLYNDPNWNTVRNVLSACSVTRVGTISINANTNVLNGVGTLFTRDLGIQSRIIVNGSIIFTIASIVNNTQATIVGASPNTITNGTYATNFDYMPLWFIATGGYNYPNRRNWMSGAGAPLKSYADVYRFHTQSNFTVGTDIQFGNIPISFNNDTSVNIQKSVNAVGLSVYNRIGFAGNPANIIAQPALAPIKSPDYPCPSCTGETIHCEVTGETYSNCLVATATNPDCDCLCNGTISGYTSYGIPPFVYFVTGSTTSVIYTSSTGYFTGLCADTYAFCVSDSTNMVECYYLPITMSNTFYAKIRQYSNGFCVTISGGTLPYHVTQNGNPLPWNDSNGLGITTNCYSADCNTQSVIMVTDSSQSTINLCL